VLLRGVNKLFTFKYCSEVSSSPELVLDFAALHLSIHHGEIQMGCLRKNSR
jgi:hypothetical protein